MISVRYTWDQEAFLTSSRINYTLRMKGAGYRIFGIFLVLSVLYGLYAASAHRNFVVLPAALLLCLYWFLLRWPLYRIQLKRKFMKRGEKTKGVHWTIDDDGFRGASGESRSEFGWGSVDKVVSSGRGYLLFQHPVILFLPGEGFASEEDIAWFRDAAREKAGQFIDVA